MWSVNSDYPKTPSLILVLTLALAALPSQVTAHELDLARFELSRGETREQFELFALLPNAGAAAGLERLVWPSQCEVEDVSELYRSGSLRLRFSFRCPGGLDAGDVLETPWGLNGSVLSRRLDTGEDHTRVLAGRSSGVHLPLGFGPPQDRPLGEVGGEYALLGMFHILEGWDHLAFVLCLCLLVTGRALLILVTGFTVGHSISLALAYLGHLEVPMAPVEAVIALSVAFMAREALLATDAAAPAHGHWRYPAVVTAFGLLHGLGFASELDGLGVSAGERGAGLLAFNIGVELGQLLFVAMTLTFIQAARLLDLERHARNGALLLTGTLGMYWFSERLSALFMMP